jgi:hypothetical protein
MNFLILVFVYILEAMFVVGAIGSTVVLILSAVSEAKGAISDSDE